MSTDSNGGKITVSEDKLRAVLAEFELRLITGLSDRFERKADVIQLTDARKEIISLNARVSSLEKWRYGLTLLATAALTLAGLVAAQLFH
jgi:hypothetical protein